MNVLEARKDVSIFILLQEALLPMNMYGAPVMVQVLYKVQRIKAVLEPVLII